MLLLNESFHLLDYRPFHLAITLVAADTRAGSLTDGGIGVACGGKKPWVSKCRHNILRRRDWGICSLFSFLGRVGRWGESFEKGVRGDGCQLAPCLYSQQEALNVGVISLQPFRAYRLFNRYRSVYRIHLSYFDMTLAKQPDGSIGMLRVVFDRLSV